MADTADESDARWRAAMERAAAFQATADVNLQAERLELAATRRARLYRFLGLTSSR